MARLTADYPAAFARDLKRKARRPNWDLDKLKEVVELVLENASFSLDVLRRRHNMHTLSGKWQGRSAYHVANASDWLVIWSSNDKVAFFERMGSHDELFR